MDREVRRELEGRFEGVVMTSSSGSDGCGVGQRALGGRIEASPQRAAAHRPHRASVRHRGLQNVRPQPLYRSPPSIHRLLESVGSSKGVTSIEGTGKSGSSVPVIGGISISLTLRGRYTSIRSGSVPGSSYTAGPRSNEGSVELVRGSVMNKPLSRDGSAPYPPSKLESKGSCENDPMNRWPLK